MQHESEILMLSLTWALQEYSLPLHLRPLSLNTKLYELLQGIIRCTCGAISMLYFS